MISVETDDSKLASFISKKQDEGWVISGVCMTGPQVDPKTGYSNEGVLIDRGCWRWVDLKAWRRVFKPRTRLPKQEPRWPSRCAVCIWALHDGLTCQNKACQWFNLEAPPVRMSNADALAELDRRAAADNPL
jgi:hypothetical protein